MQGLLLLKPVLFLMLLDSWLGLLILALFKGHTGYLHLFNACVRWSSSSLSNWLLEQAVFVLCLRVLMTLNFAARWEWLYHCNYKSVCMGFLYTNIMRELSVCGIPKVSRKGMKPSAFASSVVQWMCGSTKCHLLAEFQVLSWQQHQQQKPHRWISWWRTFQGFTLPRSKFQCWSIGQISPKLPDIHPMGNTLPLWDKCVRA